MGRKDLTRTKLVRGMASTVKEGSESERLKERCKKTALIRPITLKENGTSLERTENLRSTKDKTEEKALNLSRLLLKN